MYPGIKGIKGIKGIMNKDKTLQTYCPTCYKPVLWNESSVYRPFCSKRCQLIDLGNWANEENKIPGQSETNDNMGSEESEWLGNKDKK